MAAHLLVPSADYLAEVAAGLLVAADFHDDHDPQQASRWRHIADQIGDAVDRLPAPSTMKGATE
ncbi:hypothetical protein [Streptomyces sp. NBC_00198]|uniref:hypothetical protein n=1 Tax=Streptomyces sp. NBC_00198 TaxID=2975677 RepID=UPI002259FE3C|nr:hypothetical protein [Streptomyces sp. NBC_00198]MCX5285971.1 hypothetical protein [Streptomyces sp. NBC_00198]MCX5286280.1 hypothetical protein [Streptomyces sp. NBC_00198]